MYVLAREEIEPHGYKLPAHSQITLTVGYVSGEENGTIKQTVVLPQEVTVVGFAITVEDADGQSTTYRQD